ncbi:MAG TPA: STAS domain-containing protein [Candidatus Acidoferrum sp.]|nr:STAS domain-containing protein [Candidatus Acidoferrum sp.]
MQTPAQPFEFKVRSRHGAHSGQRVIELSGPLIITTMFPLREELRDSGENTTIIDFTNVPFMDSAGLGLLVQAQISSQRADRRFALAGMNERVRAVLDVTHVDEFFTLYATSAEAEAALA